MVDDTTTTPKGVFRSKLNDKRIISHALFQWEEGLMTCSCHEEFTGEEKLTIENLLDMILYTDCTKESLNSIHGHAKFLPCSANNKDSKIIEFLKNKELMYKLLFHLNQALRFTAELSQICLKNETKGYDKDLETIINTSDIPILSLPFSLCNSRQKDWECEVFDDSSYFPTTGYQRREINLLNLEDMDNRVQFINIVPRTLALIELTSHLLSWQQTMSFTQDDKNNDELDRENHNLYDSKIIKSLTENFHNMTVAVTEKFKDRKKDNCDEGSDEHGGNNLCLIVNIVNVIESCSLYFPELGHSASTLMTLLVTNRPLSHLALVNERKLISSLSRYVQDLFRTRLETFPKCIIESTIESRIGIAQLLNIAPSLYYLADREDSVVNIPILKNKKLKLDTILALNGNGWSADGNPYDNILALIALMTLNLSMKDFLEHCDNINCTNNCVGKKRETEEEAKEIYFYARNDRVVHIYGEAFSTLIIENPCSLILAVLFEILYRWMIKDIPVSLITLSGEFFGISSSTGGFYSEALKSRYDEIIQNWSKIPELSYAKLIVDLIIDTYEDKSTPEQRKTVKHRVIKEGVLHNGLLKLSMKCSLATCHNSHRSDDDTKPLLKCGGSCGGLARYCCKEHQKAHWRYHKALCDKHKITQELVATNL